MGVARLYPRRGAAYPPGTRTVSDTGEGSVSRPLGVSHGATHRNTQQDGFGQMVLGSAKWSRERLALADWVPVALGGLESPAALRHGRRRGLVPPQAAPLLAVPAPAVIAVTKCSIARRA